MSARDENLKLLRLEMLRPCTIAATTGIPASEFIDVAHRVYVSFLARNAEMCPEHEFDAASSLLDVEYDPEDTLDLATAQRPTETNRD